LGWARSHASCETCLPESAPGREPHDVIGGDAVRGQQLWRERERVILCLLCDDGRDCRVREYKIPYRQVQTGTWLPGTEERKGSLSVCLLSAVSGTCALLCSSQIPPQAKRQKGGVRMRSECPMQTSQAVLVCCGPLSMIEG
jgi:hypothetical protein